MPVACCLVQVNKDKVVLLRVNPESGHHGSSEQQFEELAEDWAFIIHHLTEVPAGQQDR